MFRFKLSKTLLLSGIWTKEPVLARTKFGPLVGKISTPLVKDRNVNEQNFPGWQVGQIFADLFYIMTVGVSALDNCV